MKYPYYVLPADYNWTDAIVFEGVDVTSNDVIITRWVWGLN